MELKKRGWSLDPENQKYLLALINRMNSHRLSTNFDDYLSNKNYMADNILDPKILVLLTQSNLELHSNGKIWIKSNQKFLNGIPVPIEAYNESLSLKQEFKNINETANFFEVSPTTISQRLKNNKPFKFKDENYYFKRKVSKFNYIFS